MPSIQPFQIFDAAAIAEGAKAAPKTFTESVRRLSALIDKLPQRPVIQDNHAERWVNRTVEMAIIRMELEHGEGKATIEDIHNHVLWHVRRASAIGGSEIGTVVRHFRGEKGGFSNAKNLVLEKLLIMSPQPGDEAMNRGVTAEPWIQKMHLEEHNAISDENALSVLSGFRWDLAPQLVGNPDDLVIYANDIRKIIDYKCPSAAVNEDYEKKGAVSFDYVCQVHQYAIFAKKAGVKFSAMEVVCFDPRSFSLKTYVIDPDKALVAEMVKGSAELWNNYVMKAIVPEVPGLGILETEDPDTRSLMENLTMQACVLKVIADEISARQKETLSRIKAIGEEAHELDEGKIDLGFASFDRKRVWVEEDLRNIAIAAGLEPDDFMVSTGKFDADGGEAMLKQIFAAHEAMDDTVTALLGDMAASGGLPQKSALNHEGLVEALEAMNVSVIPAAAIAEKFALSRAKKNADKVSVIKDEAVKLVDTMEEIVEQNAEHMLRDPEEVVREELEIGPD
jgi:hypothetical protein